METFLTFIGMDISIFFAQLYGIFFVVVGLSVLLQQDRLRQILDDFTKSPALEYFAGQFLTIIGLIAVLSYNVWDGTWHALISLFNWLILLKGLTYLFTGGRGIARTFLQKDSKQMYLVIGVLVAALGFYLITIGF